MRTVILYQHNKSTCDIVWTCEVMCSLSRDKTGKDKEKWMKSDLKFRLNDKRTKSQSSFRLPPRVVMGRLQVCCFPWKPKTNIERQKQNATSNNTNKNNIENDTEMVTSSLFSLFMIIPDTVIMKHKILSRLLSLKKTIRINTQRSPRKREGIFIIKITKLVLETNNICGTEWGMNDVHWSLRVL